MNGRKKIEVIHPTLGSGEISFYKPTSKNNQGAVLPEISLLYFNDPEQEITAGINALPTGNNNFGFSAETAYLKKRTPNSAQQIMVRPDRATYEGHCQIVGNTESVAVVSNPDQGDATYVYRSGPNKTNAVFTDADIIIESESAFGRETAVDPKRQIGRSTTLHQGRAQTATFQLRNPDYPAITLDEQAYSLMGSEPVSHVEITPQKNTLRLQQTGTSLQVTNSQGYTDEIVLSKTHQDVAGICDQLDELKIEGTRKVRLSRGSDHRRTEVLVSETGIQVIELEADDQYASIADVPPLRQT